jgi:hypothetical protein
MKNKEGISGITGERGNNEDSSFLWKALLSLKIVEGIPGL